MTNCSGFGTGSGRSNIWSNNEKIAAWATELLAHVATDPATVTRVLPLTSVCRYLERVGDHVTNLAEEVVYMVKATDVRHRPIIPSH